MPTILSQNADFFLSNLWWVVALAIMGLFLLYLLIATLCSKRKQKTTKVASKESYAEALGGLDNVLSHKLTGSRIYLSLKDYSLLKKERLQNIGVDGFIQKSDGLILVIKGNAQKVYDLLFNN